MTDWVDSIEDLVASIPSGSRIDATGFHFTRALVAALRALAGTGYTLPRCAAISVPT